MPHEYTSLEGGLIVRVRRTPYFERDRLNVDIWSRHGPDGRILAVAEPLTLKTVDEATAAAHYQEPTFKMFADTAQKLMDDLWDCGLRPSEGTGSAGAMAATQKHLDDLRTVAFHALKITRP